MSYWGWQKGVSALFGGIAAFVPNLYLALRIGRSEKLDAKTLLHSFYFGEAVKLLLTAILFMLILQIPYIEILPLFGSYVAALSVFWFALLWH
jgi:ATP synthase protein I